MGFLAEQAALQEDAYGIIPRYLEGAARAKYVRESVLALQNELHEALEHIEWKPWHKGQPWEGEIDADLFFKELVDAYHFLGNLMLVAGASDADLAREYALKRKTNRERAERSFA